MKAERLGKHGIKIHGEAMALFRVFLPFFAIHCTEQVYFVYGNALKGYGFSSQATGWILGIFFMAVMASRTFGGWAIENFGVRRTLVWSSLLSFAGCSLLYLKSFAAALFLGRIMAGAAFGVYTMALFSYQSITASDAKRGRDFAIVVCGGILPMATVCPVGEWLLARSMESAFLAIGPALSLVCWWLGKKIVTTPPRGAKKRGGTERWGTYGDLLSSRAFLFLVATGILVSITDAFVVSISLLAAERGVIASYFLVSSAIVAVFVRSAGAKALNRLPRRLVIAPCGMLMAAAALYIALVPSNTSFLIGGVVTGVGIGAAWPLYHALLGDALEIPLRPKGTAVALLIYDLGWFFTPLLIGYASPALGIANTFRAISLFALVSLALMQYLYWAPAAKTRGEG
ncbi:MAG: MFS transporter [Synergistaceae bacterium]|jgi:MFS family permease|nr:MFS transporter [Synergistaceae bacterium]